MISAFLLVCGVLSAQAPQAPNPTQQSSSSENAVRMANGSVPIYRVTVVARTTKAINYNHRSGPTNIDFRGTALMPEARGNAKVESKQGASARARNDHTLLAKSDPAPQPCERRFAGGQRRFRQRARHVRTGLASTRVVGCPHRRTDVFPQAEHFTRLRRG